MIGKKVNEESMNEKYMNRKKTEYMGYRDLKVFQMAYDLALDIHKITNSFPKEE
jgi:hypothetical protein